MATPNKNINVHMAVYEPYEAIPTTANLGCISREDMETLLLEIEKYNPTKHACIQDLSASYTASAAFGTLPRTSSRSLELTNMFWLSEGTTPPCTARMKPTASEQQRMFMCVKKLSQGLCHDPFIRRTLGVMLFPQFYAKNYQK